MAPHAHFHSKKPWGSRSPIEVADLGNDNQIDPSLRGLASEVVKRYNAAYGLGEESEVRRYKT